MTTFNMPNKPFMLDTEIECLKAHLEGSRKYLEFGCGGSTVLAAQMGVPKLYAVESDSLWADQVRDSELIKPRSENGSYTIRWIDIGPTGEWGVPTDVESAIKWPNYSTQIWKEIIGIPDFVLVDGRFRVSCALQTIARCSDTTKIAVHDFERWEYWPILRYAHVVEQVDNLVILRRRHNYDAIQFALDCTSSLLVTA